MTAIATAFVGQDGDVNIGAELAAIEADGLVVSLAQDAWSHAIYSTPEIIDVERGLFSRAQKLAVADVDAPVAHRVDQLIASSQLNVEQAEAVRIACAPSSLAIIEGAPGTGKSTLLTEVNSAWKEEGWRIIGASNAWKIANQLSEDLAIEARAMDSWLVRAEHGQEFLTDKTVLIIDEVGLLSSRQMDKRLDQGEQARHNGKQIAVRLIGDRKQLQPIGGPGFRIVADAIGVQRVDTIVRQRHQWARDAVTDFGQGRAQEALRRFAEQGCLHQFDTSNETIAQLVGAWSKHRAVHGDNGVLMTAMSNKQVLALNEAAGALMRADGQLPRAAGMHFEAATPSGQSYTIELVKGDAIRFLKRDDKLGVINGTMAKVVDVVRAGHERTLIKVSINGRKVTFSPEDLFDEKGRLMLAHAYASTCYSAQGLTTEHAFVLPDPSMNRHDIFVAASRARESSHLFADKTNLDSRVQAARKLSERGRSVVQEERLSVLAAVLSASGLKVSTLDYLPVETSTERNRQVERANGIRREVEID